MKTNAALAAGIRRIAREELEGALCEINGVTAGEEARAVHDTRKHIKKARALLRLVREEIGKDIFKEENRQLREVARSFASSRDSRVRLQVLEKLREQVAPEDVAFPHTAAALEEKIEAAVESFGPRQDEVLAILQRMCDRIEGWPLEDLGIDDLCCALKDAYRRGRKCFRRVRTDPTAENFHSLRKRVKDIWYQARILQNLNRAVLSEMAEAAKTLGQRLGDLHDLASFRDWLEASADSPEEERAVLLGLICARERELERVVLGLCARFFAEKPGPFERRLIRYARDWPAPQDPA
ncbi:MAG: CHAD domain-containing protein [Chthoniobacterales bacterium]